MAIRMYIIRHGQPQDHAEGVAWPNSKLSENGWKQAEALAEKIDEFGGVDVIYSSTFRRSLETAEPMYNKLKVPWHVWPALCETGRRGWPELRRMEENGEKIIKFPSEEFLKEYSHELEYTEEILQPLSQLKKYYNDILLTQPFTWEDKWWLPLINERREEAYGRAKRVLDSLSDIYKNEDKNIALVCHGAFGSVLSTVLTEGEPCDHNRFLFDYTAINCIDVYDDGTTSVLLSGYIEHLKIPLDI